MKTFCVALFCLAACAAGQAPAPTSNAAITKTVTLLEDLKTKIQADTTADQAVFDKYACWCEETSSRKAASITAARTELQTLGTSVLEYKGTVAGLATEVQQLTTDIIANEKLQKEATSIRQKQNANYLTERAEMEAALASLEDALRVLKTTASSSLLQQQALDKVSQAVEKSENPTQMSALANLRQQTSGSYAPQSSTVQGILSDMYSTFTSDLQAATKNEGEMQRNYEALMHTKGTELDTMQATVLRKEQEKAEAETLMADSTQAYSDTEAQLNSDVEFLDASKASCTAKAAEWAELKAARSQEVGGIQQVVSLLTSETASSVFGRVSLLQVESTPSNTPAVKAERALQQKAKESQSLRLAALAANLRLATAGGGHFDTIIAAIDQLVTEIGREQSADDTNVQQCKVDLQEASAKKEDLSWKVESSTAEIGKLEEVIAAKQNEETQTTEELNTMNADLATLQSTRTSETAAYEQGKQDTQEAITLLQDAKAALSGVAPALVQKSGSKQLPGAPDATFNRSAGNTAGAAGMVELLMEDLQKQLVTSDAQEAKAQAAYEAQIEKADAVVADLQAKLSNIQEFIAQKNEAKVREENKKQNDEATLELETNTETSIKPRCDNLIANVESRREKRQTEMDGLKQAKYALKGAQTSFLAKRA